MFYQEELTNKLDIALENLFRQLQGVRTGRASVSLFDSVMVDYYGAKTPLPQVASFNIPEARQVVIQPWDKVLLPEIEKAIRNSELSLAPTNDGQVIRIQLPALTTQRRQELVKQVRKLTEQAKVVVRNIRREVLEKLKKAEKAGDLGEDTAKKEQQLVERALEKTIHAMEEFLSQKEIEILED